MSSFKDVWAEASKIKGFFSDTDAHLLWVCALESSEDFDSGSIYGQLPFLEIGSFHGRSTRILATHGLTISIEPSYLWDEPTDNSWDGTSSNGFKYDTKKVDMVSRKILTENMKDYPWILIPQEAKDVCLGNVAFSLIFIDGDHTEGGIDVDCEKFLPHLVAGGYALFHDYDVPDYPAVKKYVDQYTAGWEFIGRGESLVAFRKPL